MLRGQAVRLLTIIVFLIVNISFNVAISAAASGNEPVQKGSADAGAIFTAIDAAEAMSNGASGSALTEPATARKGRDENESMRRLAEGTKYYQEKLYDQAAREYTLAMRFSPDNYTPYKLRADTYMRYLLAKIQSRPKSLDTAQQELFDRVRTLICKAINADYTKALALNDAIRKNNNSYMLSKKSNLGEKDQGNEPYSYYEKGQRTGDMLLRRSVSQSQRKTIQTDIQLKKAMEGWRAVCEDTDDTVR